MKYKLLTMSVDLYLLFIETPDGLDVGSDVFIVELKKVLYFQTFRVF